MTEKDLNVIYWCDANYSYTEWIPLEQHKQKFQEQENTFQKTCNICIQKQQKITDDKLKARESSHYDMLKEINRINDENKKIELEEQADRIIKWYKQQWDNGNPVSPNELKKYLKGGRDEKI